ncbi:MAG: aminotransferase class III-fold pyridoxal phosphate-dependent enzyme, partial [Verrucomicrobiae bacterium]|nr:aminotransferase class III-fold pyridoxal phosphate-dependent enzyme [Verrucomicrobiae bacterium]
AVLQRLEQDNLLANARRLGAHLLEKLSALPRVSAVRGIGLMIGVDTPVENRQLVLKAAEKGLLVVPAGTHTVRMLPPLNITETEANEAITRFAQALEMP